MSLIFSYAIVSYVFISVYLQLIIVFFYFYRFFKEYFLNKKSTWNPNRDRLLSVTGFICIVSSIIIANKIFQGEVDNSYLLFIYLLFITGFNSLVIFISIKVYKEDSASLKIMEKESISNEKESEKRKEFQLCYDEEQLKKLYQNLIKQSFIKPLIESEDMTDDDQFIYTLYNGILPNKPLFKLNFDNIQTKYFFDKLTEKENPKEKLTMEKFLTIFKNKNKEATPQSISSSYSKSINQEPKEIDKLNELFVF